MMSELAVQPKCIILTACINFEFWFQCTMRWSQLVAHYTGGSISSMFTETSHRSRHFKRPNFRFIRPTQSSGGVLLSLCMISYLSTTCAPYGYQSVIFWSATSLILGTSPNVMMLHSQFERQRCLFLAPLLFFACGLFPWPSICFYTISNNCAYRMARYPQFGNMPRWPSTLACESNMSSQFAVP